MDDPSVLDFDMLQTGHNDRKSVPNTIETVNRSLAATPKMPVLIGEVCYEGIQEASRQEVQRFMFWSALLSGTAGHTYGANGIWQVNTRAATLRTFAAWPLLGRSGLGYRCATSRLRATRPGQGPAHALFLVEARSPIPSSSTALEQRRLLEALCRRNSRRSRHCVLPRRSQTCIFHNLEGSSYHGVLLQSQLTGPKPLGNITPGCSGSWKYREIPIFQDWVIVLEHKA